MKVTIDELAEFNDWWKSGKVPERLLKKSKRTAFKQIYSNIKRKQIISITGLRRTGKTTLIYQVIQEMLSHGVKAKNLFYFNFDEFTGVHPKEVIEIYITEMLNKTPGLLKEKIYIFLDEIQKSSNWEGEIKKFYDLNYQMKFVVFGSASLKIRKKTIETLAGRTIEIRINPMKFREFLKLKGFSIKSQKIQEKEIKAMFYEYAKKGGFPEFVEENNQEFIKEQIKNIIIDRIIYQDIPEVFNIKEPNKLLALMKIIANNPGIILEYNSIASDLGVTRQTVSNMISYLENTFLIKVLYNFSNNFLTSEKKAKRAYPSDHSIAQAYNKEENQGKIIETIIANHLNAKFFWRDKSSEIDFIVRKKNKPFPIEVKFKNTINKKELKNLTKFMKKYKIKEGQIITKTEKKVIRKENITLNLIPVQTKLLDEKTSKANSF